MSGIAVVSLVASVLGLVATSLNLAAFVREKDRSHTRAGLAFLFAVATVVGLLLLPSYAPETAGRLVASLPAHASPYLEPWLRKGGVAMTAPDASGMRGAFTIEIQRNFFGGIGALVSNFAFANPSEQTVKVTGYHVRLVCRQGEAARNYDRVLEQPVAVEAGGNGKSQVELDAEIRDQWVTREGLEPADRGPIEISWDCQSADGRTFTLTSSNG